MVARISMVNYEPSAPYICVRAIKNYNNNIENDIV